MDLATLAALAGVGVIAGIVNTVAGGGSLLTLPAFVFAGLDPATANGTNRIGVLAGSVVAAGHYRKAGMWEAGWPSAIEVVPVLLGAVGGAWISLVIDEAVFEQVMGVALIAMLATVLARPAAWIQGRGRPAPAWARGLGFACVGAYGGFLQAGVGVWLLAAFVGLSGTDLVVGNVRKVLLVTAFTLPAFAVFLVSDAVAWAPGLAMAVGASLGGWIGARWTLSWGPGFVRVVLVIAVTGSAGRLLGWW